MFVALHSPFSLKIHFLPLLCLLRKAFFLGGEVRYRAPLMGEPQQQTSLRPLASFACAEPRAPGTHVPGTTILKTSSSHLRQLKKDYREQPRSPRPPPPPPFSLPHYLTVTPFRANSYRRLPSLCRAENIGGTCMISPVNCPSAASTISSVTCSQSPCRVASPSASWVLVSCPSRASAR